MICKNFLIILKIKYIFTDVDIQWLLKIRVDYKNFELK